MEEKLVSEVSEPIVTYGPHSYADVMMMIYSMQITPEVKEHVGRRLMLEVTEKNLSKAFRRLDQLAQLKNNWDGYGALPVSAQVMNNIRRILVISDDEDWDSWTISPDVNGTICLYSPKTKASISIGAEEYSYFAMIDGVRYGESHVMFTPLSLLELMRKFGR